METQNLVTPLHESLDLWYNKAKKIFNIPNWNKPKLDIVSLTGRVAGKAICRDNTIQVNWKLYTDNQADFLHEAMAHELSHIIDYKVNGWHSGKDAHSAKWQFVGRQLGISLKKCHNYDTSHTRVQNTFFVYSCPRCHGNYNVDSKNHHLTIANSNARLQCPRCKIQVVYSGKTKVV
jgi:predicted SprT family Zn-dependent metalloprotease